MKNMLIIIVIGIVVAGAGIMAYSKNSKRPVMTQENYTQNIY